MDDSPTLEQAAEIGASALKFMAEHEIVPHPHNFEIWYHYFSRLMPQLRKELQARLDKKQPFNEKTNQEIYDKFIACDREGIAIEGATNHARAELSRILQYLETAGTDAAEYGKVLEEFSGEMTIEDVPESFRKVIGGALEATREMEQKNKGLEQQFNASSDEISRLREDLEVMRHEAMTDALTGIANRKLFDVELHRTARQSTEESAPMSLLILDIDHFKKFNDTYGHLVGDQVLRLLALTIKNSVKGQDVAARFGGEEFCIILPDTNLDNAVKLAEIIRSKIANKQVTNRTTGETLGQITVSIGVACYRAGEDLSQLIQRSDEAMYKAKRNGRNRVVAESGS